MLGALFAGNVVPLRRPVTACIKSIQRIKAQKAENECGLVARVPDDVFSKLLALIDERFYTDLNCAFQTSNGSHVISLCQLNLLIL